MKFNTRLYQASGGFVCLALPRELSAKVGNRGRTPVIGTLNRFPIRTSVFPTGDGGHFMLVNKTMQQGAAAAVGDKVQVALEIDTAPRTLTVPADLKKTLAKSKRAKAVFDKLPYSHQKKYVDWMEEAKRPETRTRRITEIVARLQQQSKESSRTRRK